MKLGFEAYELGSRGLLLLRSGCWGGLNGGASLAVAFNVVEFSCVVLLLFEVLIVVWSHVVFVD